jgi:hypothetical protein
MFTRIVSHLPRFVTKAALATALVVSAAVPTFAKDAATPDWPCIWRKTVEIDAGTIWDGPALDAAKDWIKDDTVRNLSSYVIARRLKPEEVEAAVKKFADAMPEASRDQKLTELFAGALSRTNDERKIVVGGIERFHKRQLARAKEIESQGLTLPKPEDMAVSPPGDAAPAGKIEDVAAAEAEKKAANQNDPEEKMKWEIRIFQERQQNIPIACEIPQLMDERIGLVGRAIRALMKS